MELTWNTASIFLHLQLSLSFVQYDLVFLFKMISILLFICVNGSGYLDITGHNISCVILKAANVQ